MENATRRTSIFYKITLIVLFILYGISLTKILTIKCNPVTNVSLVYFIFINLIALYKSSMHDPGVLKSSGRPPFCTEPLILLSKKRPADNVEGNSENGVETNKIGVTDFHCEELHASSFEINSDLVEAIQIVENTAENRRLVVFHQDNTAYSQKHCSDCNLFRPAQTSHCSDCGYCILERSHHCIWLDNCIGRNNYRDYFTFIVSLTVLSHFSMFSLKSIHEELGLTKYIYLPSMACLYIFTLVLLMFTSFNLLLAIFNIGPKEFKRLSFREFPAVSFEELASRFARNRPAISLIQDGI